MRRAWSEKELKIAFYLYCQTPFGKMNSRNPEIAHYANIIGRTSSALAMKLVNFASLDPVIIDSGRKGLSNASKADRKIWDDFHSNWDGLFADCELLLQNEFNNPESKDELQEDIGIYSGKTRTAVVLTRVGQHFFRKSVLSSYQNTCCISGVSIPQFLIASHILPWSKFIENRLNPSNGLCLSVMHDKAFDSGFISISPDYIVKISEKLKTSRNDSPQIELIVSSEGSRIALPEKFYPNRDFLRWHEENVFLG